MSGFALSAPATVAASAGEAIALQGIRWTQYREPARVPGTVEMFELDDPGEFREWAPRGA